MSVGPFIMKSHIVALCKTAPHRATAAMRLQLGIRRSYLRIPSMDIMAGAAKRYKKKLSE